MEKELKRIAHYLLLHGSAIPNIGLLYGKTGICMFFFHYARKTSKEVYKQYAEDLLDEVYREVNVRIPATFRDGLAGIGWGISYLAANKFVKVDSDKVLKTLDNAILERDVRRMTDTSLDTGLRGIAYYALSRCADKDSQFAVANKDYLSDLLVALQRVKPDGEIIFLTTNLERFISHGELPQSKWFLQKLMKDTLYPKNKLWKPGRPIGIAGEGFAGVGLKLLNVI